MYKVKEQVLLGTRVPANLKNRLSVYCLSHGIKMSYFVAEAIQEKLQEMAEDKRDLALAKERLKSANYISANEFHNYLGKRGIRP